MGSDEIDIPPVANDWGIDNQAEWADILGQGTYTVQEDNSEWDEKAPTPDLFENED